MESWGCIWVETSTIIAIARTWIGTPFHWHGRSKGIGCDCGGFLLGVLKEAGVMPRSFDFHDYGNNPLGQVTLLLKKHCQSISLDFMKSGDIVALVSIRGDEHMGFYAVGKYYPTVIHASIRHGVIENRLLPSAVSGDCGYRWVGE